MSSIVPEMHIIYTITSHISIPAVSDVRFILHLELFSNWCLLNGSLGQYDHRKFETTFEIRPNEKLKLIFFVSVNPLYAEGSNTKQFPIIPRSNCHSFLQSILFRRQTRIILFSLKQGSSTKFVNELLRNYFKLVTQIFQQQHIICYICHQHRYAQ